LNKISCSFPATQIELYSCDLDLFDYCVSGYFDLNDLYSFDPATVTWKTLMPTGPSPSPRKYMGFVAIPDGLLYLYGGYNVPGFLWKVSMK
jgi:hypothetical protein